MTKAEEMAAKTAKLRERQGAPAAVAAVPTEIRSVPAREVRVRPVRLTVDVSPADHVALSRWCLDAAAELGVVRVHGQELVRALIHRALHDPELRAAITDDAAAERANR